MYDHNLCSLQNNFTENLGQRRSTHTVESAKSSKFALKTSNYRIFREINDLQKIVVTSWFDGKIKKDYIHLREKYFWFSHCEAVIANIAFVQKEAIFQEEERKERIKVTKLSTLSTSSNSSRTISFDEFRSRFKPLLPCSQFRTPHIRTSCGSSFQNVKELCNVKLIWQRFDKKF